MWYGGIVASCMVNQAARVAQQPSCVSKHTFSINPQLNNKLATGARLQGRDGGKGFNLEAQFV